MNEFNEFVKKLEEVNGKNDETVIKSYEIELSKNIEELSNNENFFNLPLKSILSIISKVDFSKFPDNIKIKEIIQNIIINLIDKHFNEKETILILQNLNIETIPFSYEEIFSILELITNCPVLVNFCNFYKDQIILPFKDYEYEIQQKNKEIEKLKQKIHVALKDEESPIEIKTEEIVF